jgi:pyrroline-5-carboxylate reductase
MNLNKKIAIIGGGNLGSAIASGLLKSNIILPQNITLTRRKIHIIENFRESGINVISDNFIAVNESDLLIFAVKPNQLLSLLTELKDSIDPTKHIIISAVTGVNASDMETIIGKTPVFRIMPNTAISILQSITCISFYNSSTVQQNEIVELFNQLGKTVIINEELMGAATVLGACGIAFAMRYMRASAQAGIEMGFSADLAQLISTQTLKGAADLILANGNHPEKEIDKVTTPMGVTISGLNEMEYQGFSSSLIKGLMTSYNKLINGLKKA